MKHGSSQRSRPRRAPSSGSRTRNTAERASQAKPSTDGRDDTKVSVAMLEHAMTEILTRVKLDCKHDIPYLAGYSRDGRTIYIDRHVPKTFLTRGHRVKVGQFLVLHEAIEKALLARLGLIYQHAHQIALRAEEAAVRASGVSWQEYDRFMSQYIKEVSEELLSRLPHDLDIKPYRDEKDTALLKRMIQAKRQKRKKLPA